MSCITAYGIQFMGGWWSGRLAEKDRMLIQFSYRVSAATLLTDLKVAEDIAKQLGGVVKHVELTPYEVLAYETPEAEHANCR